jgi:peroxiredoxin
MGWLIAAVVLAWILIGVGVVFIAQLILQNGRLLLRIEQVESKLSLIVEASQTIDHGLAIGSEAPLIELPSLDAASWSLLDQRGQRSLVLFFSHNCGYCLEMIPDLEQWRLLKASDLNAVATQLIIVVHGEREEVDAMLGKFKDKLTVLFDTTSTTMRDYEVVGTPTAYLIDEEGRIASLRTVGRMSIIGLDPQWMDAIDRNSDDRPPPLATRAWNLTQSLADFAADGFKTLSTDEYQTRLAICDTCDRRRENTCLECGCYLPLKAKGRAFECPIKKWPKTAG